MLRPTDETLINLMRVRDVVFPRIWEAHKAGQVDLLKEFHPCGTPSCLAGYIMDEFGLRWRLSCYLPLYKMLGLSEGQGMFCEPTINEGRSTTVALKRRYKVICDAIEERLALIEAGG